MRPSANRAGKIAAQISQQPSRARRLPKSRLPPFLPPLNGDSAWVQLNIQDDTEKDGTQGLLLRVAPRPVQGDYWSHENRAIVYIRDNE